MNTAMRIAANAAGVNSNTQLGMASMLPNLRRMTTMTAAPAPQAAPALARR